MSTIKRIGVLTGGGDAPGLNAVIRAVVKSACNSGIEVRRPRRQLRRPDRVRSVRGPHAARRDRHLRLGGTILGTVNRGNPFAYPIETSDGTRDYSDRVIEMFHKMGLDALVVHRRRRHARRSRYEFYKRGIPLVGVPKTIDNDIVGTTNCFGFDTAVAFATDAIDRLHTTAEAHRRIMVVEVMGRYAGWIALHAGVAGGADVDPDSGDSVRPRARGRSGCAIATAGARGSASSSSAEGAHSEGRQVSLLEAAHGGHVERLGGVGAQVRRRARTS